MTILGRVLDRRFGIVETDLPPSHSPGAAMDRRTFLGTALASPLAASARDGARVSRLLYVVCPGIRDYLEFGGAGIMVFDI